MCQSVIYVYIEFYSSLKVMLEYNLLISLCLTAPFSSTNPVVEGVFKRLLEVRGSLLKELYILALPTFSPSRLKNYTALRVNFFAYLWCLFTVLFHLSPKSSHSSFLFFSNNQNHLEPFSLFVCVLSCTCFPAFLPGQDRYSDDFM